MTVHTQLKGLDVAAEERVTNNPRFRENLDDYKYLFSCDDESPWTVPELSDKAADEAADEAAEKAAEKATATVSHDDFGSGLGSFDMSADMSTGTLGVDDNDRNGPPRDNPFIPQIVHLSDSGTSSTSEHQRYNDTTKERTEDGRKIRKTQTLTRASNFSDIGDQIMHGLAISNVPAARCCAPACVSPVKFTMYTPFYSNNLSDTCALRRKND